MVGAIGFEFWGRRSFNNIERTAGTVKQWKAMVNSANGSQTDHGLVPNWRVPTKVAANQTVTLAVEQANL